MSDQPGVTQVGDSAGTRRSDPRLAVCAYCEDAAANIGLALALGVDLTDETTQLLGGVQNDLLDVLADLRTPMGDTSAAVVRIDEGYLERGRYLVDHYSAQLSEPTVRVVPGGTVAAALLHKARTGVRLAEISSWEAIELHAVDVNRTTAEYLGVLGELLLALARTANLEHGDTLWRPGLSARQAEEAAAAMESSGSSNGSRG